MIRWAGALLFCKILDVVTTYYLVNRIGIAGEVNPFVRWTMWGLGASWALLLNFFVFFFFFVLAFKVMKMKQQKWVFVVGTIMMVPVVVNNLIQVLEVVL